MGGLGAAGPSKEAAARGGALPGGPAIILAAAERGAGKSTAFALAAAETAALGWEPCGIVCPGVYRDGMKTAALCRALLADGSAGEPWGLARVIPGYDSVGAAEAPRPGPGSPGGPKPVMQDGKRFSYGKWEFSLDGLGRAERACLDALARASRGKILFIDEIGPLELTFGLGLAGTLAAVDRLAAASPVRGAEARPAAIVAAVRPELAEGLAKRWRGARIIRAASATMAAEALAADVVAALRNALGRGPLVAD